MPPTRVRAAVVGGSLGGLTCALLVRDLGVQVDVYERSPSELMRWGVAVCAALTANLIAGGLNRKL